MNSPRPSVWIGGLLGIVILISVIFLLPFLISGISCPNHFGAGHRDGFLCEEVPEFFLALWPFFDWLSLFFCRRVCRGEDRIINLFTTLPSFFIIGVVATYILRRFSSPKSNNFE